MTVNTDKDQAISSTDLEQELGEDIAFRVVASPDRQCVVMSFNKAVKDFAMGKEGAIAFAQLILRHAESLT
jgi:hypothetical protein